MSAKIRLKVGDVEAEYEGDPAFMRDGLIKLMEEAVERFGGHAKATPIHNRPTHTSDGVHPHSTNTVASILGSKTGGDLAMAAAAHLTLAKDQARFTRKQILEEMQGAATFYKSTYSNNLSATLNGLVKSKKLNLVARDTYAIGGAERQRIEASLAHHG